MKKLLLLPLMFLLCTSCALTKNSSQDFELLTLFSSSSKAQNQAWVGTFQLVFNDMKNNIIKKDIVFEKEKPTKELISLNNEEFNSSMLNESSYYTSYGETSLEAKKEIEKGIKEKFNETSDILDSLDWTKRIGSYYAYAMLKKNFEFLNEFDVLENDSFNSSKEKYKYFGIKNESNENLNNNVRVLFYNNKNDYAIQLITKTNDVVYLYRTDKNKNLKNLYNEMLAKQEKYKGSRQFNSKDTLKIPNIKLSQQKSYPQLCNKIIKGTNLYFSQAIETLKLEMDNKGGSVKSEAMIMTKATSIAHAKVEKPKEFNFNKTFTLFLVDINKQEPYLALKIKSLKDFQ